MTTTTEKHARTTKTTKHDPFAKLRERGLVIPPRSTKRDTSMPTIKPKGGGSVMDLVEEWR